MAERDDVLDLLLAQHAEIERLFEQVIDAEGEIRRDRFEELVRLLSVHETAEEELVHPLGRGNMPSGDEVIDARLAEERDAKQMLADLYERGTDDPEFPARFEALREAVLTHAKREERYEFPYLNVRVAPKTRARLAKAVRAAQKTAPTRPHPGLESAKANLLAGPPLAVVDRMREALRSAVRESED